MKEIVILNEEDNALVSEMKKIFDSMQTAHSEFQIKNFILNTIDNPIPSSQYFQATRELYGRYNNLVSESYQYKKTLIEVEKHKNNIKRLQKSIDEANRLGFKGDPETTIRDLELCIAQEELDIEHKNRSLYQITKNAKECIREMKIFYDCLKKIELQIPEHYKNKDGIPDREKSEMEHWVVRQYMCEQMGGGDPNKTPFTMNFGLDLQNNPPKISSDHIGRLILLPPDENLHIEDNGSREIE